MMAEVEDTKIQMVVCCQLDLGESLLFFGRALETGPASRWSFLVPNCGKSETLDVLRCRKDLFHFRLNDKMSSFARSHISAHVGEEVQYHAIEN